MKEHQKRDILIISSVLVVVLLAVLLLNRDKPFSIFSSGDQAKQVTNAYLQQTDQLEPDFTPNPNEAITLSTNSTFAAVSQPTSTQQSSELDTETYLPSSTQALDASATGTTPASIVATNTRAPAATSTKASTSTQATQSVSTSYPVPTSQSANTSYPVPTYELIVTHTPSSEPTKTSTATATLTTTFTPTPTFNPSKVFQAGWEGEWIAYLAQPDGSYRSGDLIVSISGDSVTGVFDNGGITMNLEGSLQIDRLFVRGNYILPSANGSFKWMIQENYYLVGHIDNEWAFCAAREGLPQPDPCGDFDPR